MRRFLSAAFTGIVLCAAAATAAAQQVPDQGKMKKQYDEKVAESWVKDGGWILDYDAARAEAKASKKLILAYFTRSYAG
jgi:hypothetical protein